MRIKCEYCDNFMDDSETKCPSCGAPNKNAKRTGVGVPTTIEELKQWYEEHHLPPYETTRFFIGINYEKPKAFGIYKDDKTGNFVVYKNKDTGDRAIRYEGTDEKYAVNELYLKLKEEIAGSDASISILEQEIINRSSKNNKLELDKEYEKSKIIFSMNSDKINIQKYSILIIYRLLLKMYSFYFSLCSISYRK